MSAGFFGKWEPVDTNKPQTTPVVEVAEPPVEQEPVVADNWPQNDSDEGFLLSKRSLSLSLHTPSLAQLAPQLLSRPPPPQVEGLCRRHEASASEAHASSLQESPHPQRLESRVRSWIPSLMRKSPTVRRFGTWTTTWAESPRSLLTTETKRRTSLSSTHGFLRRPKAVCRRTSCFIPTRP